MPKFEISAPVTAAQSDILSKDALDFLVHLSSAFEPRRQELLARRVRQAEIDAGKFPDFLPETESIREADWTVAPIPADLLDRRVEITGPVDRKMVINALNSGANVFMADFEDSNSPTWDEQHRRPDQSARRRPSATIDYTSPEGKQYKLNDKDRDAAGAPARLALDREARAGRRPADLRLALRFRPVLLSQRQGADGARAPGPYFYLPKTGEPSRSPPVERRLSSPPRTALGVPRGTIRATVLIETILGRVRDGRDPL